MAERPVGDPERGAAVFKEHCAFCHSFDPTVGHKKGPNLSGLWGRERGSAPGFKYVESDEKKLYRWDDNSLWSFFAGPHIPGSKFIFGSLKNDEKERADLLSYLKEVTSEKTDGKKG